MVVEEEETHLVLSDPPGHIIIDDSPVRVHVGEAASPGAPVLFLTVPPPQDIRHPGSGITLSPSDLSQGSPFHCQTFLKDHSVTVRPS